MTVVPKGMSCAAVPSQACRRRFAHLNYPIQCWWQLNVRSARKVRCYQYPSDHPHHYLHSIIHIKYI